MNSQTFNRLHELRMENTAAGYAMAELKPRFDRLAGRHENGTAPRAVSAFQLFQTPPALAARLVALLGDIPAGSRILEPSAGLGRILDAIDKAFPNSGPTQVAVEMAANVAGELYAQNRAGVKILQRDFLTVSPAETGLFDYVAMNPPFHLRADIRHIEHALTFLKPGGILAAICFNTPPRVKAFKGKSAAWEELPGDTFSSEGTHVPTVLLTIQN